MPDFLHRQRADLYRRRFLIGSIMLAGVTLSACASTPAPKPPKILFVCEAGTAKSAISRELLQRRARKRGISVEVFSRGINVADHLSPQLKQKLRADGIDTTAEPALPLEPSDWAAADILVYFNPLPAIVAHPDRRNWSDVPSVNDDYANARMILDKRIDALLDEIAKR